MAIRKFSVSVTAFGIACLGICMFGCSTAPKAPSPTEAAAAAQKVDQSQQQQIQTIQNDPNLSDAQKAARISALGHDATGPNFGRGARATH